MYAVAMLAARALPIMIAFLGWSARPADACQCGELDEAAAIEASSIVLDGWVIAAPDPWHCPLPPAPRPRPGCVRIAVVDGVSCEVRGDLMSLETRDRTAPEITSVDSDATTFCGVKPGKYLLTVRQRWGGSEDGTVNSGRTLDVVPGGSYVVFSSSSQGQKLRVGVFRAIKGAVPREVTVITANDCGAGFHKVGDAVRFFGHAQDDGTIAVRGCASWRPLTEVERVQSVAAPPPTVAVPPPPPSAPTPSTAKRSGGCSTTPTSAGLLVAWLFIGARSRRRGTVHHA